MNSAIPVCLEVGHQYRPKAEYSIRMLLGPLGLGPIFQPRNKLIGSGIYYGNAPSGLDSKVIVLPIAPNAEKFFDDFAPLNLASVTWQEVSDCTFPILFSSEAEGDLIASTFYWLSGWQENTILARDSHGRFLHKESVQERLNVTHIPVVECYREILRRKLVSAGIQVASRTWAKKKWAFCPTIDVDYFQHWRLGMIYREEVLYFLLNHRKVSIIERWRRLFQFMQSYFTPGDAFQTALYQMYRLIRRYGTATVFIKAAAHGPHDVYYRLDQKFLQRMLRDLESDDFELGLHPSYYAHTHLGYLRSERRTLTRQSGIPPVSVRQHFLRYDSRITPQHQVEVGFRIDSTLGFAECAGFRNGTCMPFLKFDCTMNEVMDLWEMPVLFMDGALFNRQHLKVGDAIHHSMELLKMCQKFGGVGVGLWHNVMGEKLDYPGWGEHFEAILQWCSEEDAYISSLKNALSSWRGYPV